MYSRLHSTKIDEEPKTLSVSERGLTSTQWSVYDTGTKRMRYSSVPTSTITAETVTVDGFARSQKDTAGIMTTATRAYTAGGLMLTQTDGRGNTTTTLTDIAGRTTSVTDAAGNVTTTAYDIAHDQPSVITDAQGNTSCYRYDARGHKVAEWGTGIQSPRGLGGGLDKPRSGFAPEGRAGNGVPASQPVCFGYDDADNMTSLTTFRVGTETISTDPTERTDGDTTHWLYDPATGLELSKTYADNSSVVKSYDVFNRLATETDARGNVKTHAYESARGLLLGTTYSVVEGTAATTSRSYAYNHLGQLTQVVDDAGTRTIAYNTYGEQDSDSLNPGTHTHLITEQRDSYGRSIGYTYARSGTQQHRVTIGYGTDGRIATAGFLHGNSEKQFSYGYLPGSNLLQTLTMPNNMTLTQSYETQRDLLTGMSYKRGNTPVAERSYSYDTLGRPLTRSTTRSGQATRSDSFSHNERSELSAATLGSDSYSYAYDNIGNRTNATEGGIITAYASNNLNQYTAVGEFTPTFDADGNQTLVKSSTGIWAVQYNAENRPVSFTNSASNTVVECTYDSMGRRATKKVITNGSVTSYLRFIYRGYLQIAAIDAISGTFQWFLVWDPIQTIATRPLAIRKDGTWFAYGWDLTKNICEVFGPAGYIRTAYTYSPYGEVSESGDVTQPIQWSSEVWDSELGLTYYNWRYYNTIIGRWNSKDRMKYNNLYIYVKNNNLMYIDLLGNSVSVSAVADKKLGKEEFVVPTFNFEGLIDLLVKQANQKKKKEKCPCISEITIVIHGNPQESVFGCDENIKRNDSLDPRFATQINDKNAYALFTALKEALENKAGGFCKNCVIWYTSCNTGLSSFVQKIANATRCKVYAPKGYSFGNDRTKGKTRIQREIKHKDPNTGEEKIEHEDASKFSQNGQQSEDGMFRVYKPYKEGENVPREKYFSESLRDFFADLF